MGTCWTVEQFFRPITSAVEFGNQSEDGKITFEEDEKYDDPLDNWWALMGIYWAAGHLLGTCFTFGPICSLIEIEPDGQVNMNLKKSFYLA